MAKEISSWKQKSEYKLMAPENFDSRELGSTFASDPKKLGAMIRDCQNKGMLIIATYDIIKQLKDEKIAMGLDRMLYPVGEFTQVIHGLNFAIRAALSFGGIQKGDREGLLNYLSKRPKVFVLQLGPLDFIKVAAEFAVMFNGSSRTRRSNRYQTSTSSRRTWTR